MRRAFLLLAAVPVLRWAAALRYLAGLEGWGAWGAAGALLVPVIALSVGLGLAGAALWWRARRRREPAAVLGLATAVASSVACYYAARALA